MKKILTIAGSDPSGGAGIQADIKTITVHGMYACSVITSLTAQNTTGVYGILNVPPEFVAAQMDCVFTDIYPDAVKIGMVSEEPILAQIIAGLQQYRPQNLVIDPVMISTSGRRLLSEPAFSLLKEELLPLGTLITPNLPEAAIILDEPIGDAWAGESISDDEAQRMVEALLAKGTKTVVLKGVQRGDGLIRNFVGSQSGAFFEVNNELLPYMLHGTGDLYCSCLLAAVMAGKALDEAVRFAGDFVHDAMIVSSKQPQFRERGVSYEPLLGKVTALLA